jgi:hypothetical protein
MLLARGLCRECRLPPRPTRFALPTSRKRSLFETGGSASELLKAVAVVREPMGDRACWLEFCPHCDAQVTVVDEECPDCGAVLD